MFTQERVTELSVVTEAGCWEWQENTYVWGGKRHCRACNRAAHQRRVTRKREAAS